MNYMWLLRMAQWVRHPPSMKRVKFMGAILAVVLVIVALDMLGLWPDWAHMAGRPRMP